MTTVADPQRHAADPAASAWVEASAGTGKTHVLTSRVLRLLLAGAPPENILCLTFTRAAAAEMATRVQRRLAGWATAADADLATDLGELKGAPATDAEAAAARRLFARVLDAPGGLRIETIHAFAESLLKRFPLEADLPPHFQLMDDRDALARLSEALAGVLAADAAAERPLLPSLVPYVNEDAFTGLMLQVNRERGRLRALLDAHGPTGAILRLRAALGLADGETADTVLAAACDDRALDGAGLRRVCVALAGGGRTDQDKAAAIDAWLAAPATRAATLDAYRRGFFTGKGERFAKPMTKAPLAACPDGPDILAAECARLEALQEKLAACRLADANAALLRLADRMLDAYGAAKARRALLDYDDLILRSRDLLTRPGVAPWVLFKLDGRLDHVLIDEAQDTNPDQWQVVAALTAEFFAGEGQREAVRTVFAVGDPKQSIYSFQRADPAAFERMRRHYAAAAGDAGLDWRPVELHLSFRSTRPVLDLVDAVFRHDDARDGLLPREGVVRHEAKRADDAGLVELWPLEAPAEAADEPAWTLPTVQALARDPHVRLAERIADTVGGWIERGEPLAPRGRPIRAGDVLILVQRRQPFLEAVVRALKRRGVPVAGADRMVLTDQIAVMDLMALGRFLLLPEDDLNLATVLKGPLLGLDDDDLFRLAHGRPGSLWRALRERAGEDARFAAALGRLDGWLGEVDYRAPFAFFARLLGGGGARRALLGRLGPDAADPLDEFLSLALHYEAQHAASMQGFLAWLEGGAVEVKRDQEERGDEVRVMTVHGAKGLQAPIVFLPDTTRRLPQPDPLYWLDGEPPLPLWCPRKDLQESVAAAAAERAARAQAQENRRLLYVALTRAADRLYVAGWRGAREPAGDCWYRLVERAMGEIGVAATAGERTVLRHERPQTRPVELPPATAAAPDPGPSPAWTAGPAPAEPTPPRPLAPSRPEEPDPPPLRPLADDGRRRYRRGLLVHRLLQSLPDLPPAERAGAARRSLGLPAHELAEAERAELAAETLAVLEHPDFGPLFGPGSLAEAPVAGVVGGHAVSARIDRLAVLDDRVLVVDYKTNRPAPAAVADVPVPYLRQMAVYRALLSRIWPGRPVEAALLWTDGPRLMALPTGLLDRWSP